jgi:signal transduction histidine kinase
MNREPLSANPQQVDAALRAQLSDISAVVQVLSQNVEPGKERYLGTILRATYRALKVVEDRALARQLDDEDERHAVLTATDMVSLARSAAERAGAMLGLDGITVTFQCQEVSLVTRVDPGLVERMMLCLIANGAKAAQTGGQVAVSLSRRDKWVLLTVCDDGQGMSEQALEQVCSEEELPPDLTPGTGAGFGLRLSRAIAETHGGLLLMESAQGEGTKAAVSLPIRDGAGRKLAQKKDAMDENDRALMVLSDVLSEEAFLKVRKRDKIR